VAEHGRGARLRLQRVRDFVSLKAGATDIDPTLGRVRGLVHGATRQLGPAKTAIADRMPPQVRRTFYAGGLPVPSGKDQAYRDSYGAMLRMVKAMYDAGRPGRRQVPMPRPSGSRCSRELNCTRRRGFRPPA